MVVDKAHYFQTVNGDGLYELSGGNNNAMNMCGNGGGKMC